MYSTITGAHDRLKAVDNLPRLAGVPLYPTRLMKLNIADSTKPPTEMTFQAVLVNPDELFAEAESEDTAADIPGFVTRALSRGSVIEVTITLGDNPSERSITVEGGRTTIDWVFGLNRQERKDYPFEGFDGKLSRLNGTVEYLPKGAAGLPCLRVAVSPEQSRAYLFNRLWPLDESVKNLVLLGSGDFRDEKILKHETPPIPEITEQFVCVSPGSPSGSEQPELDTGDLWVTVSFDDKSKQKRRVIRYEPETGKLFVKPGLDLKGKEATGYEINRVIQKRFGFREQPHGDTGAVDEHTSSNRPLVRMEVPTLKPGVSAVSWGRVHEFRKEQEAYAWQHGLITSIGRDGKAHVVDPVTGFKAHTFGHGDKASKTSPIGAADLLITRENLHGPASDESGEKKPARPFLRYLLTGGKDGQARLWNVEDGSELKKWTMPSALTDTPRSVNASLFTNWDKKSKLSRDPDNPFAIVTVDQDKESGFVRLWSLKQVDNPLLSSKQVKYLITQFQIVQCDGKNYGISLRKDGNTIDVWDLSQGIVEGFGPLLELTLPVDKAVTRVSASVLDKTIHVATAHDDKLVRVWKIDVEGKKLVQLGDAVSHNKGDAVSDISLRATKHGLRMATCSSQLSSGNPSPVELWNIQAGEAKDIIVKAWQFLPGRAAEAVALADTPDGLRVLVGADGKGAAVGSPQPIHLSVWTPDRILRISSDSRQGPECHLPVELKTTIGQPGKPDSRTLRAQITRSNQAFIFVEEKGDEPGSQPTRRPAVPQLLQGIYFCFLVDISALDRKRGRTTLITWIQDQMRGTGATVSGGSRIGAILASEQIQSITGKNGKGIDENADDMSKGLIELKLANAEGRPKAEGSKDTDGHIAYLQGISYSLNVISSAFNKDGNVDWIRTRIVNYYLETRPKTPGKSLMLHIGDQLIQDEFKNGGKTKPVRLTGLLTINDKIQCPMQLRFHEGQEKEPKTLELERTVFLARPIEVVPSSMAGLDIVLPDPGGLDDSPKEFELREIAKDVSDGNGEDERHPFFSAFGCGSKTLPTHRLIVYRVPGDKVPIDLCLEREATTDVPRASSRIPQLVHRVLYGPRLRYRVGEDHQLMGTDLGENPKLEPIKDHWIMAPLAWVEDRLVVLEESVFLEKKKQTTPAERAMITQNLLVMQAPVPMGEYGGEPPGVEPGTTMCPGVSVPIASVLNRSSRLDPDEKTATGQAHSAGGVLLGPEALREHLRESGAKGVAVHRTVVPGRGIEFRFVNSPFYSLTESEQATDPEIEEGIERPPGSGILSVSRSDLHEAVAGEQPKPWSMPLLKCTLDFRLEPPGQALRRELYPVALHYVLSPPISDPLRADKCVPKRAFRLTRAHDSGGPGTESFSHGRVPHFQVIEATAFRKKEAPAFLPEQGRRASVEDHLFLPRILDFSLAPDKPGAMFHHLFQTRLGRLLPDQEHWRWSQELLLDFAAREPQQIRLRGCVSAEIELKKFGLTSLSPYTNTTRVLKMEWDEILGTVPLNRAAESFSIKLDEDDLVMESLPFQLIVQFNDDLYEILPQDYSIPAYRIEYRSPQDEKKEIFRPPKMYLLTLPGKGDTTPAWTQPKEMGSDRKEIGAIAASTGSTTPPLVTTKEPHGLKTGDRVDGPPPKHGGLVQGGRPVIV
ncbi:WD40 repeat domain-containing protein [Thermodesulfobacteriota bacterium]